MTERRKLSRNVAISALSVCVLIAIALGFLVPKTPGEGNHPVDDYPELFTDEMLCRHRGDVLVHGRKEEELARLRADRYAYDPGDGIRAVHHYQEAEACYLSTGAKSAASRVHRTRTALIAQVNTDYAAARLNLANALEQERWSAALDEIHRLLLLTKHLRRHPYVEWLNHTMGRVAAEASIRS